MRNTFIYHLHRPNVKITNLTNIRLLTPFLKSFENFSNQISWRQERFHSIYENRTVPCRSVEAIEFLDDGDEPQ